jgi:hypothetical protein
VGPKIRPGQSFDEVIDRALEAARCVIVLWSKKSVSSRWVKAEASEGNRRGILVPALIEDDARIPLEFRYQHASRLTDWRAEESGHLEFDELKDAIGELLRRPPEAPRETADSEVEVSRTILQPSKTGSRVENQQVRVLRIVVASPGDVQAERNALPEVIAEINRGVAADRDLRLELSRWETDTHPGFHADGPQGAIDPILKIENCDVLIGIFWRRFGTPTKDVELHQGRLGFRLVLRFLQRRAPRGPPGRLLRPPSPVCAWSRGMIGYLVIGSF